MAFVGWLIIDGLERSTWVLRALRRNEGFGFRYCFF
jgi:hypothetical protein